MKDNFFENPFKSNARIAFSSFAIDVIDANMRNKKNFSHIVCQEMVFNRDIVMYFRKNFYLAEAINKKLGEFLAAGIIQHIIDKYIDEKYWKVKPVNKGPMKITLNHLRAVFMLWVIFVLISIMIFTLEHIFFQMYLRCKAKNLKSKNQKLLVISLKINA